MPGLVEPGVTTLPVGLSLVVAPEIAGDGNVLTVTPEPRAVTPDDTEDGSVPAAG